MRDSLKDLKHLIFFENLLQDAQNELVTQAVNDGKIALGYNCYYIPEVLLNLPGCFSTRLRAPRCESTDIATYYMTSRTCPYVRSILERAIEGGYNYLGALFGAENCAAMERMEEHFFLLNPVKNDRFFVTQIDPPMKGDKTNLEYYEGQLKLKVVDQLAKRYGIDVSDAPEQPCAGLEAFYAGAGTLAEKAARAAALEHVDFVCIRFDLADPNGANKSVADCVADAKAVADAVDKPIVVAGCKNAEKDAELFAKVSEALQGRNILVLSAKEENYKGIAAGAGLAYGQKVGAESAVDINLAKQLNVLITQMGLQGQNIAMNIGSAAAGYGFEYVASTLERVKAAALTQNDTTLQMPIITPVIMPVITPVITTVITAIITPVIAPVTGLEFFLP